MTLLSPVCAHAPPVQKKSYIQLRMHKTDYDRQ